MKIVTVQQMQRLEQASAAWGVTTDDLMERAGLAVAQEARKTLGAAAGKRILVLVGPGNNGGDGLVTARHLQRWGALVTAYVVLPRKAGDPKAPLAAQEQVALCDASSDSEYHRLEQELARSDLVVDAVLGTGRARSLEGCVKDVLVRLSDARAQRPSLRILALDLPTGVDADSGAADPVSPQADVTVTLGYPKAGLFQFPAASKVGRLVVADIGIPAHLAQDIELELLTATSMRHKLPSRPLDAHKGTFGHALVIAGSSRYVGAAYLVSEAAARVGAGLVTLAAPGSIYPMLASKLTEVIHLPLPEDKAGMMDAKGVSLIKDNLHHYSALAVGCGMGRPAGGPAFMEELLLTKPQPSQPVVIDADGLNNLAAVEGWWQGLKGPTVLTPHPGEMAHLTGEAPSHIQSHRIEIARKWAARWGTVVVLKGAFTVVASPKGSCWVSPFANPALATGGTGDVLTGIIAGLLAHGLGLEDAACCGVFLHGMAAQRLREEMGDAGVLAGDLLPLLPRVIKNLRAGV